MVCATPSTRRTAEPVRAWRNLLVALGLALLLTGCGKPGGRQACPAGETCLHIGNSAEPITLDPHKSQGTWEQHILIDSLMGLTQEDIDGNAMPGMAERWTVSPDGLTWTFYLRDATWSDSVPLTAEDFAFSFRRILTPATASNFASMLYMIHNAQQIADGKLPPSALGVRALSPRVLELSLDHPAPYMPELAKHTSMLPVPKHMVEKYGDAWSSPDHYVSNGPYRVVAWRLGDYVKAVKNPRFYDAAKVCVDQVYYYPTTDSVAAERQVARGELDISTDIQSNRIGYIEKKMPGYARIHTYLGVSYLAFNLNNPKLKDVRVRQALSMAVDREFIADKLLRGGQTAAYTFVPPGVANYTAVQPPVWAGWTFAQRQAEARRLLAAAGYGLGHPLKLEIKHRNAPDSMLLMPAIQADWKAIGVQATLVQNEVQIAYAAYRSRDFEVADGAWVADYNDPLSFLYVLQGSTGTQNYGDYKSPVFDGWVDRSDHELDATRRAADLAQAEQTALADAAVAPTYFWINKNLVNPDVTGWKANLIDYHPTRYVCKAHR
jgi:oligopeptide transport system substrate-binding protein